MLNKKLKRMIGTELHRCRSNLYLRMEAVAERCGIPWQRVDKAEIGAIDSWDAYQQLLDAYGKDIAVVLVDKQSN